MKWIVLLLLCVQSAVGQQDVLHSTQTTWKATQKDAWISLSRVKLAESVTNQIVIGGTQASVGQLMGDPDLATVSQGKTFWSYGLYRDCLFHVVFDRDNRVVATETSSYRPYSEAELGSVTNIETTGQGSVLDAISWKLLRNQGKPHQDRVQVAACCAKSLHPGLSEKDVECIFGKPEYAIKRGLLTYWIFRTRASTFLVFEFLDTQEMIGAYFRHYNNNTGRLNCIPVSGVIQKAQGDELLDQDCWLSTVAKYDWTVFRTGISVRMATYIVPGMPSTDVDAKLGKPTERSAVDDLIMYKYLTSPASCLKIAINKNNLVDTISTIMVPIP